MSYVEIALNIPVNKTFHYGVPDGRSSDIAVGKRVWVSFGRRRMVGYVVGLFDSPPAFRVKDIEEVIDAEPILSYEMMKLTKWISDYYCTAWGMALAAAIPAPLKSGKTSIKERKSSEDVKYP